MKKLFLILFFIFAKSVWAQGGPPMITDDPHTVGDGKWEINIAQVSISNSSSTLIQSPYLDVNYGLGKNLQLKYESGVSSVIPSNIPYAGSYANAGVRWRFFEDEQKGQEISIYPQYSFSPSYLGTSPGVNTNATTFFLPLEFSQKWDFLSVNPELGYGFVRGDSNYWSFGLLFAEELSKYCSIMQEVHFVTPLGFVNSQNILNFGTAFDATESLTLLASVGSSFAQSPSFWISYLALQIHL